MKAWQDFLLEEDARVGKETVDRWLRSLKVVKFDSVNLFLEAENIFQKKWFDEHVKDRHILNNNFRKIKIHIDLPYEKRGFEIASSALDPNSLFESFYPFSENLMAFNLLKEIPDQKDFNPIYIFGPPSSGKSHLLMATMHALRKRNISTFFTNGAGFTQHVVNSMRASAMNKFREIYREIDVLIVDDIHLLENKSATQEEFFHSFNTLYDKKKQIIVSSRDVPRNLTGIEERLISRFEWGLTLPLSLPKEEDRAEILNWKLKYFHLDLSREAKDLILKNFTEISVMAQAIETIMLRSHIEKIVKIDHFFLQNCLKDLISENEKTKLSFEKIVETVAIFFGLQPQDILSRSQTKERALPRQLAMYLCREKLKVPYMKIGQFFARDHSTVMGNIEIINRLLAKKDEKTISNIQKLDSQLRTKS